MQWMESVKLFKGIWSAAGVNNCHFSRKLLIMINFGVVLNNVLDKFQFATSRDREVILGVRFTTDIYLDLSRQGR